MWKKYAAVTSIVTLTSAGEKMSVNRLIAVPLGEDRQCRDGLVAELPERDVDAC